VTDNFPS